MAGPPWRSIAVSIGIILVLHIDQSAPRVLDCEPRDCRWDRWLQWSPCEAKCNSWGKRSRVRFVKDEPRCGGLTCDGTSLEVKPCFKSCKSTRSLLDEAIRLLRREHEEQLLPVATTHTGIAALDTGVGAESREAEGSGGLEKGSGEEEKGSGEEGKGSGEGEKGPGEGEKLPGEGSGEGEGEGGSGEEGSGETPTQPSTLSTTPEKPSTPHTAEHTRPTELPTRPTEAPTHPTEPPTPPSQPPTEPPETEPPEATTTTSPAETCAVSLDENGDHVIDTDDTDWERSEYCEVFLEESVTSDFYKISTDLYLDGGKRSSGDLGLMYNVINRANFDFVTFRTSLFGACLQYGYYKEGLMITEDDWTGTCSHGSPDRQMWFKVAVHVSDIEAHFTLDGYPVATVTPHYQATASGGIISIKGYKTLTKFKNYVVEKEPASHPYPGIKFYSCLPGSRDTFLAADPDSPGTFCHAVVSEVKATSAWTVSVDLYNEAVWTDQPTPHTGVMYQFTDWQNYEVITFEFHKDYVCMQGGMIEDGQYSSLSSQLCLSAPPPSDTWFHVKVEVTKDKEVRAQLGNKETLIFKCPDAELTSDGDIKAGVAIANGHIGVLRFKNFEVENLDDVFQAQTRNNEVSRDESSIDRILRMIRRLRDKRYFF